MAKKRILYIVNSLGQGSGVMSFIMNLYRNMDKERIQIDFIVGTKKEPSYENEIISLGGRVYHLPAPRRISLKNYNDYISKINNFFNESNYKYEIIHSHVPIFNIFYFPIAKKNNVRHFIAHSHSTKSSSKLVGKIRNYFLIFPAKKLANNYFACSKEAGVFLFGEKNVKQGKVHIIHNAIDCRKFDYNETERKKVRETLGIENQFVVGHVGRFAKEKNHKFLVDVFYEILKLRKESVLILIGDGALVRSIQDRTLELGISNKVKFLGVRADIHELMQAMDVFIMPSTFEGLGIVAIEAQSVGLPCFVSNNVPKDVEITDLTTHLPLEKSPSYWATQIVDSDNFKKARRSYSKEVIKANYDISSNVKWLEDFYLSLN